jgi:hypothetical protein
MLRAEQYMMVSFIRCVLDCLLPLYHVYFRLNLHASGLSMGIREENWSTSSAITTRLLPIASSARRAAPTALVALIE